jgi:hypothetical protein
MSNARVCKGQWLLCISSVWCVVCGVWCVVCGVWCVVCAVCKINDGFCTRLKGKTGKTTGVLMSKLPQLYERQNYHNSMNNTFIFYTQGSAHHHSKARVDKCKGPKCSDTGTVRLN